jgi:hypothetical protein
MLPIQLLAKFLFRGQKETGRSDRARHAEFLIFVSNPLSFHGLRGFASGIFRAGIAAA